MNSDLRKLLKSDTQTIVFELTPLESLISDILPNYFNSNESKEDKAIKIFNACTVNLDINKTTNSSTLRFSQVYGSSIVIVHLDWNDLPQSEIHALITQCENALDFPNANQIRQNIKSTTIPTTTH